MLVWLPLLLVGRIIGVDVRDGTELMMLVRPLELGDLKLYRLSRFKLGEFGFQIELESALFDQGEDISFIVSRLSCSAFSRIGPL